MKLYVTRDRTNDDLVIFAEAPEKGEGPWGAKWNNKWNKESDSLSKEAYASISPEVCEVATKIEKLLSPLTFEAGQLAEIEVREVQRWELPD